MASSTSKGSKGIKITVIIVAMLVLATVSYFMFFKKNSKIYVGGRSGGQPDVTPQGGSSTSTPAPAPAPSSSGGGAGTPVVSSLSATPFKNTTEGNKFRAWVNDNHPDYARQIDLDRTGAYDNSFIRKAWKTFGDQYTALKGENPLPTADQSKKSFDSSWYKLQASMLLDNMEGISNLSMTANVITILKKLKTDRDWQEVYSEFGSEDGWNLREWLQYELSNLQRKQVNDDWESKGMTRRLYTKE